MFGLRRQRGGLTLLEMLMIIVIMGILAAIVLPKFFGSTDRAWESARLANLRVLQQAVNLYRTDYGTYPQDLATLTRTLRRGTKVPYLNAIPQDPITGRDFCYDAKTGRVLPPINQ